MLKNERKREILNILKTQNGFVAVKELCEKLFASESSIRRDLERLQKMNLLKRTHGGASLIENTNKATPLDKRMTKNTVGKRKIAKKALKECFSFCLTLNLHHPKGVYHQLRK